MSSSLPDRRPAPWAMALAVVVVVALALVQVAAPVRPLGAVEARAFTLRAGSLPATHVILPGRLPPLARGEPFDLEARLVLPDAFVGESLVLVLPFHGVGVEAYVDGAPAEALVPAPQAYRHVGPLGFGISADLSKRRELSLRLHLANTWSGAAWFDVAPRLELRERAVPELHTLQLFGPVLASVAAGAMGTVGFLYALMYLLDRRQKAMGWFAVMALSATVYCVFSAGWAAPLLGPLEVPSMAVALTVAIVASVWFAHTQLGLETPSRALWLAVPAVGLTFVPGGAFGVERGPAAATVAVVICGIVYQSGLMVRLRKRAPERAEIPFYLACWIGLAATGWTDVFYWLGIPRGTTGLHMAPVGLTIFAGLQSVVTGRAFLRSILFGEAMNAELQTQLVALREREREVTRLNEELQRQVAARTDELSQTFTRLATFSGEEVKLALGDVVDGRYLVQKRLGTGGAGGVYRVARVGDGRSLALKVLLGTPDVANVARFAREAQLAASIRHPNVVRVVDADVARAGFLYVVMELVDGKPLHELRHRFGDVSFCLDVLLGLTRGLVAIHEHGIVHRDLKPANILVAEAGSRRIVKIADFGVSRAARPVSVAAASAASASGAAASAVAVPAFSGPGAAAGPPEITSMARRRGAKESVPPMGVSSGGDAPLTRDGDVIGTPAYLAPEAFEDATRITDRSDVYSLGVVAHELLTGTRPVGLEGALARALGQGPRPTLLLEARRDLPPELSRGLDRCLALLPGDRPSAQELLELIERAALS